MTLRELQRMVFENSCNKGFHTGTEEIDQKLLLVVSEVCEAQDALRSGHKPRDVYYHEDGKPDGFGMELADAVIRILDLCEALGIDLEGRLIEKHHFNTTRPHMHGRSF